MNKIFLLIPMITLFSSCSSLDQNNLPPEWSQYTATANRSTASADDSSVATDPLKIAVLNVGQGDATLITTPNGKSILIDAGANGKGRAVVLPYLKNNRINALEAILATHYDADHIGGIDEVIAGADGILGNSDDIIPQQGAYDRGGSPYDPAPSYPFYVNAIQKFRNNLQAGQLLEIDPQVSIRCIAINGSVWNGSVLDLTQAGFSETENSASVVLLIEYGKFSYLTSGDLTGGGSPGGYKTIDVESAVANVVGPVSAVHVNHHGSLSSSNTNFINILKPKAALFNVGDANKYNHPAQQSLEKWQNAGAELWLTEKGAGGYVASENITRDSIELSTDGNSFSINQKVYSLSR